MTDTILERDGKPAFDSDAVTVESGLDVVSISRFRKLRNRSDIDLRQRVFTDDEISYCEQTSHPGEHYAVRWCVKEAVRKIVDKPGRVPFRSVAVERAGRKPQLAVGDAASRALAETIGTKLIDDRVDSAISLTHDRDTDTAAAVVTVTRCP